ncbi:MULTISPECIES: TetR/AcrR family transcriptional regulator [unclassified Bacillus (in: firmicutes)]|uniref:TetR/AcrR family transcriptional regulator n=1 Tax=unclassified Bacillus (in: firmicutes) TaxID=185979 RepID=UPI0008E1C1F7|nr:MULTISPECIES: TetR family transcriptional regulator [unclassified Bacillus (in: firmicutes)]SFA86828.1 DNA-binding transcriptional regulator, AcrR family [Bacillus sp. UNCCL13]SFQ83901.1 DNA-binding transcriptional regulator, AcrR family [Bacillus sp. cl95]
MSPKLSQSEKEKRRKHIIDSAIEVFKLKGFEAATMKDIVDQTGNSRGWVYLYFSSVEEIFEAMINDIDNETIDELGHFITLDIPVWESIGTLFEMLEKQLYEEENTLYVAIYEYFIGGYREPKRRDFLKARYNRQNRILMKLLEKGVNNGEFRSDTPILVLEKLLMSFWEGLILHSTGVGVENLYVKEQFALMKKMLASVVFEEVRGGNDNGDF